MDSNNHNRKDCKTKCITKDKEGHAIDIIIKRLLQKEDVTFIKINRPNITAPRYIKEILTDTKGEIDNHTILEGHLNPPITSLDRSFRKKIYKETVALGATFDWLELIGIYRTKAEEQEIKLSTSAGSLKKQKSSRKRSISALLTMPKPLIVRITINCGKF